MPGKPEKKPRGIAHQFTKGWEQVTPSRPPRAAADVTATRKGSRDRGDIDLRGLQPGGVQQIVDDMGESDDARARRVEQAQRADEPQNPSDPWSADEPSVQRAIRQLGQKRKLGK